MAYNFSDKETYDLIPEGDYEVVLSTAEIRETNDKSKKFISCKYTIAFYHFNTNPISDKTSGIKLDIIVHLPTFFVSSIVNFLISGTFHNKTSFLCPVNKYNPLKNINTPNIIINILKPFI